MYWTVAIITVSAKTIAQQSNCGSNGMQKFVKEKINDLTKLALVLINFRLSLLKLKLPFLGF